MRLITLTQHDARAARDALNSDMSYGEDDGVEGQTEAPTRPVVVNADFIRAMTDRRTGPGTRITFADGGGFSVKETVSEVLAMVQPN